MPDGFTVEEVRGLLGVTASAVHADKNLTHVGGRGSLFEAQPVIDKHEQAITELENKLRAMRAMASELGIRTATPAAAASSAGGPNDPTIQAQVSEDFVQLRIDQAVAQQEIDRLKAEVRDANRLIDGLKDLLSAVRPRENVGLDEIE